MTFRQYILQEYCFYRQMWEANRNKFIERRHKPVRCKKKWANASEKALERWRKNRRAAADWNLF